MPLVAGIDCGTGVTKALLLSQDLSGEMSILGKGRSRSGINVDDAASNALSEALANAGANRADVAYIAATGFGRYNLGFRDIAWSFLPPPPGRRCP